jgi:hypothetical protein
MVTPRSFGLLGVAVVLSAPLAMAEPEAASASAPAPASASAPAPASASGSAPATAPAPSPTPAADSLAAGHKLPALHHAPVVIATADRSLVIEADIDAPELVKHALVVYRTERDPTLRVVELLRSPGDTAYAGEIPAHVVKTPWLDYTIEFEMRDGSVVSMFGTREELHRVSVPVDYLDLREKALLGRLGGRRSLISTRADYVTFVPLGSNLRDAYWQVEGGYTFRPLRALTEFTVKAGVLRGITPRNGAEAATGMYYTAPAVRVRLSDAFHVDVEGLTGVTQSGFEFGGGAELLIGDPYGSKLAVGVEAIHEFGTRGWSRVDITATRGLMVSPTIEVTNFPYAERFGVRLALHLGVELGSGVRADIQGGYQAREMAGGGPGGGVGLGYAF